MGIWHTTFLTEPNALPTNIRLKNYLANQLAKVEVDNITAEEHKYLNEIVLKMYANPLINQLRIKGL